MEISTAGSMTPVTADDFEVIKEMTLDLAAHEQARVRASHIEGKLYVGLERTYADIDFLGINSLKKLPPLTICFTGLLQTVPGGTKMALRYREITHNHRTKNSSINHDYVMEMYDGEITACWHRIRGCPQIGECRQEITSDQKMDQAEAGKQILQQNLGGQLELTAGDCGILYERILGLME